MFLRRKNHLVRPASKYNSAAQATSMSQKYFLLNNWSSIQRHENWNWTTDSTYIFFQAMRT